MKLSSDEIKKLSLVLVWAVLGLIVYTRFILGPQWSRLEEGGRRLLELKRQIAQIERASANQGFLEQERAKLVDALKGRDALIAREGGSLMLLGRLSSLAEEHDVRIIGIEETRKGDILRPAAQGGAAREIFIGLSLISGYHELGAFMNELESMTPVVQLVNLEVSGRPEDVSAHQVSMLLKSFVAVTPGDEEDG